MLGVKSVCSVLSRLTGQSQLLPVMGFLGSVSCSLYSLIPISLFLSLLPLGAEICLFIQAFSVVGFVYVFNVNVTICLF